MAKASKSITGRNKPGKNIVNDTKSKTVKSNRMIRYIPELCQELEQASAGLFNISEQDTPYQFFTIQQRNLRKQNDKLTALEFISGIGLSEELMNDVAVPVSGLIEERSFDNFFPTIDDLAGYYGTGITDPKVISLSKQYRKLEALLKKRLHDVKVFRIGKVEIRCYIAGFAKHGNIAGLVTTSIET